MWPQTKTNSIGVVLEKCYRYNCHLIKAGDREQGSRAGVCPMLASSLPPDGFLSVIIPGGPPNTAKVIVVLSRATEPNGTTSSGYSTEPPTLVTK